MVGLGMKYTTLIAAIVAMFVNFVACGSQFYKMSLKDDTQLSSDNESASADPASPTFGLHSPGGWMQLPIHFRISTELDKNQQAGLLSAMRTWEIAVGKKLFVFEGMHEKTGDAFGDLYSSLKDNINGTYLDDNWKKMCGRVNGKVECKDSAVLATTIWNNDPSQPMKIDTADVRFNSNYYLIGDAFLTSTDAPSETREHVDMATLATHELGHLLGLTHIPPNDDGESIMNPALYIGVGLANRRISKGDLLRIQKIYGCSGDACNAEVTLDKIDKMSREEAEEKKPKAQIMQDTAH